MSFSHFYIVLCVRSGADVVILQVIPQGVESLNGSDINMGCTSPLVDRGDVMVCDNSDSYSFDGCSPTIDTSTSNWASQLVTVRKNEANDLIQVAYTNSDRMQCSLEYYAGD